MRDKTTHTLSYRQFRTSQSNKRVFGLREKTASPGQKLSRHRGKNANSTQKCGSIHSCCRSESLTLKYVLKVWAFRAFEKNLQLSNSGGTIFFEELKHKFSLNRFYFVCEIPPHHMQRHTNT